MAYWVKAKDGDCDTRKDWSTRRVPVYNGKHRDDAILDAARRDYTVTVTKPETVTRRAPPAWRGRGHRMSCFGAAIRWPSGS